LRTERNGTVAKALKVVLEKDTDIDEKHKGASAGGSPIPARRLYLGTKLILGKKVDTSPQKSRGREHGTNKRPPYGREYFRHHRKTS